MAVADLLKDRTIKALARQDAEPGLTVDYVKRRVRRLIDLDPALQVAGNPGELTAAGTTSVRAKLVAELPKVRDRHVEIRRRVGADRAHMDVASPAILRRVATRPPAPGGSARAMRRRLVATIVYQAAAFDITLADPANIDRLHILCDRRLRLVERMLYDVGRVEPVGARTTRKRKWSRPQVAAHPGGPWEDGWERSFEYPRVPQAVFATTCRADPTTRVCQAPMSDWRLIGVENLVGPERTNPGTTASWRPTPAPGDPRSLRYTPGPLPDAVTAVERLFAPSTDFLRRNMLFCEQTLHILHLESLVFAHQKRLIDLPGNRRWLDNEANGKPPGWLRIYVPQSTKGGEPFLAGPLEPAHFEHASVREADLQPGDHAVVYNHRAYRHATVAGVWQLEHSLVVQSHPDLRLQGHGSRVLTIAQMRQVMVDLFNEELERRCRDVDGLATVVSKPGPRRAEVSSLADLRRGMRVEIADQVTDAVVVADRQITEIDHRHRVVTYSGDDAATPAGLVLRRPRVTVGGVEQISVDGHVTIRRRVPANASTFDGRDHRADWYLSWIGDPDEHRLRTDPAKASQLAFVRHQQWIDYEPDAALGSDKTRGWFPLWRRTRRGDRPVTSGGRLLKSTPIVVGPEQIAGWTWFFDPDPAMRDRVAVIRPREP